MPISQASYDGGKIKIKRKLEKQKLRFQTLFIILQTRTHFKSSFSLMRNCMKIGRISDDMFEQ